MSVSESRTETTMTGTMLQARIAASTAPPAMSGRLISSSITSGLPPAATLSPVSPSGASSTIHPILDRASDRRAPYSAHHHRLSIPSWSDSFRRMHGQFCRYREMVDSVVHDPERPTMAAAMPSPYDEAKPEASAGCAVSTRELPEWRPPHFEPHARAIIRDLDRASCH